MTCQDRDSDLLLYGLGELPILPRMRAGLHLLTCPRCRARQAELAGVSHRIAAEIRPLERRADARARRAASAPRRLALNASPLLVLLLLLVLAATAIALWYVHTHSAPTLRDQDCRPGLASDECK